VGSITLKTNTSTLLKTWINAQWTEPRILRDEDFQVTSFRLWTQYPWLLRQPRS